MILISYKNERNIKPELSIRELHPDLIHFWSRCVSIMLAGSRQNIIQQHNRLTEWVRILRSRLFVKEFTISCKSVLCRSNVVGLLFTPLVFGINEAYPFSKKYVIEIREEPGFPSLGLLHFRATHKLWVTMHRYAYSYLLVSQAI